jgi:hypothetical protein
VDQVLGGPTGLQRGGPTGLQRGGPITRTRGRGHVQGTVMYKFNCTRQLHESIVI